jgi:hypothetical protein
VWHWCTFGTSFNETSVGVRGSSPPVKCGLFSSKGPALRQQPFPALFLHPSARSKAWLAPLYVLRWWLLEAMYCCHSHMCGNKPCNVLRRRPVPHDQFYYGVKITFISSQAPLMAPGGGRLPATSAAPATAAGCRLPACLPLLPALMPALPFLMALDFMISFISVVLVLLAIWWAPNCCHAAQQPARHAIHRRHHPSGPWCMPHSQLCVPSCCVQGF